MKKLLWEGANEDFTWKLYMSDDVPEIEMPKPGDNGLRQIKYDLIDAYHCGIKQHPQDQMEDLGYEVVAAVPQSIGDCWWFTVKDFIEPLPGYLRKIYYDYNHWHKDGFGVYGRKLKDTRTTKDTLDTEM